MNHNKLGDLHQLANLYDIQTSYYDVFRQKKLVEKETLLAILRAFNVDINSEKEIKNVLLTKCKAIFQKILPPVTVAWNGKLIAKLLLPEKFSHSNIHCHLLLDDSNNITWTYPLSKSEILQKKSFDNNNYVVKSLEYLTNLPLGYHQLNIQIKDSNYSCMVISAPKHAYISKDKQKKWGLFAPIYALRSKANFGAGNLADLNLLMHWVADHDGNLIGTLPIFSQFSQKDFESSPYSPISKLFFNEFYLDIVKIPEFSSNITAQRLYHNKNFQEKIKKLEANSLVDYSKIYSLKRKIIEILSNEFFSNADLERDQEFKLFCKNNPRVIDYANFLAVHEIQGKPWPLWPDKLKSGTIHDGDYQPQTKNYFLYCQWQIQLQIKELANEFTRKNVDLYLDMPLGVHPHGYDVWKNQHLFAHSLQIGSPIDAVFTKGQKWGFPPLIPHLLRETNYQYFIQTLRQIIPYVNLLRLDHVMGLHRLYCIPKDFKASQGAYIHYSAEEFYAIISLESQRYKTEIIGENLGNVPHYVNKKIIKHHLYFMHILQHEISAFKKNLTKIRNESISSLNTHDMPTFAAYVQGLDIISRRKSRFLSKLTAAEEWQRRKTLNPSGKMKLSIRQLKHILQDSLYRLADDPSKYLLINLEDLWLETMPQNIPNSGKTYPNWKKKFKFSFEKWTKNKFLCTTIYNISLIRKK